MEEGIKHEVCFEKLMTRITDLIGMSEARIDRTNDMICKAFNMIEKITNEYTTQIEKLQDTRDKLVTENANLIKLIEKFENQLDDNNKRYDRLLEKLISVAGANGKSENNINVK